MALWLGKREEEHQNYAGVTILRELAALRLGTKRFGSVFDFV